MPELPTMSEFLPGYEATAWFGVGVPISTAPEIVNKLNWELTAILSDPKMKAGYTPMLKELMHFFQTREVPVPNEVTLEMFAFMDAAQRSKLAGGKPQALR